MPARSDASHSGHPRSRTAPLTGDAEILALYGAFCLFLSTLEFLIPKPVPFFRVGLANLPILLALRKESPRFILALVGLKIFGQALVNGTLFSYIFVFSTAGSLASGILMMLLSFLPVRYLSLIGISVMGALSSNLVQILLARYFLLGEGAWLIGPPFLAIGTVTGILLGGIALSLSETFVLFPFPRPRTETDPSPSTSGPIPFPASHFEPAPGRGHVSDYGPNTVTELAPGPTPDPGSDPAPGFDPGAISVSTESAGSSTQLSAEETTLPPGNPDGSFQESAACRSLPQTYPHKVSPKALQQFLHRNLSPGLLFLSGVLSLPPFLFTESLFAKGLLTGFYFLCAGFSGKRIKLLPNLIAFLGITATNLVTPLGEVLFYIGTFPVTLGALRIGAFKALTLLGMIALSRFTLSSNVPVPGRLGAVLARMFFYFERITERKIRLRRTGLWEDLKTLIEEVQQEGITHRPQAARPSHTTLKGYLFMVLFLSVSWAALGF